jgi:hypothetical protein
MHRSILPPDFIIEKELDKLRRKQGNKHPDRRPEIRIPEYEDDGWSYTPKDNEREKRGVVIIGP